MKLLDKTREAFASVRSSIVRAMQLLWKVKETEEWKKGGYDSFGAYVEGDLGISPGFASKLGTINRVYLIEGGILPEKLEGIDHDKLYAASKIERIQNKDGSFHDATVAEQFAIAQTNSRTEVNQWKSESKPHTPTFAEVCTVCWVSKANHG